MLNMIKMDLYRMFRTKSMYVLWLVMALMVILSSAVVRSDANDPNIKQQTQEAKEQDNVNLAMSVVIPTAQGERISVYDLYFANSQGKSIALLLVIFTVIFAMADGNTGYIKNFGGQVRHRWKLVLSKALCLLLFTAMTMLLFIGLQAASSRIFFGYLEWGQWDHFLTYLGTETVLHFALVMIVMALSIVLRNTVFSMAAAICLCMNMMALVYVQIDRLIGIEGFHLADYTVTGRISALAIGTTAGGSVQALAVSAGFIAASAIVGCTVFQKRDIH